MCRRDFIDLVSGAEFRARGECIWKGARCIQWDEYHHLHGHMVYQRTEFHPVRATRREVSGQLNNLNAKFRAA